MVTEEMEVKLEKLGIKFKHKLSEYCHVSNKCINCGSVEVKGQSRSVKTHKSNNGYHCSTCLSYKKRKVNNEMENKLYKLGIKIRYTFSSIYLVSTKCIKCGSINELSYKGYRENYTKNNGDYFCSKCTKTKRTKETNLKKYGVEYVSQVKEFKEKVISTNIERYGETNHMKNKTQFEKYKKNMVEKYGYETPFQSKEILEKAKQTSKEKYGVDNVFQNEKIKDKCKKTKLEKYGDETFTNKEKFKETMFEKYGVDNPSKSKEMLEKVKQSKIKDGYHYDDSNWKTYSKIVRKLTMKHLDDLFGNWDGYDTYDNEYIKENLTLNYNDKKYPTVDHIISVSEGYKLSILPQIIANIDNLCITKRTLNCKKGSRVSAEKFLIDI